MPPIESSEDRHTNRSEPTSADAYGHETPVPTGAGGLGAWANLLKVRLNGLVVFTTAAGFVIASRHAADQLMINGTLLAFALVGTALAAAGSAALNAWWERDLDARMPRTAGRPLPTGRIRPGTALLAGLLLAAAGVAVLAVQVNWLAASLALIVNLLYVLVYTPLKTTHPWALFVGAICGAIPPAIGAVAATATIGPAAIVLFALLALWQVPHTHALTWLHQDGYAAAGYRTTPQVDPSGRASGVQSVIFSVALAAVPLGAFWSGVGSPVPTALCAVLSVVLIVPALRFAGAPTKESARVLFRASLVYLPLALLLMIVDAVLV